AGVACGATTCQPGQLCCATKVVDGGVSGTCASSCGDMGIPVGCFGPQHCDQSQGTTYCCATQQAGAGTFPNCANNGTVTTCTGGCITDIKFMCNTQQTVRLCRTGADCTDDSGNTNCC